MHPILFQNHPLNKILFNPQNPIPRKLTSQATIAASQALLSFGTQPSKAPAAGGGFSPHPESDEPPSHTHLGAGVRRRGRSPTAGRRSPAAEPWRC